MTIHSAVHCPECGAITRRETQDDGWQVLVCTDDECDRIIVGVLSRPSELAVADAFTPPDVFSKKV